MGSVAGAAHKTSPAAARRAASAAAAATGGTLVPTPSGTDNLFLSPDRRFVYGLTLSGTLSVIDLSSGKIVRELQGLYGCYALAFDAAGKYAYVPNSGVGTIYQIDLATLKVIRQIPVGGPLDELDQITVQSTAHGDRLYVTAVADNAVYVIDTDTDTKTKIPVLSAPSTVTLAGDQLVVTQGYGDGVEQIDTITRKVVARLHRPNQAWVATAALVRPHTVAVAGLGQTQFFDTVTHKLSPPLGVNSPGNLNDVTATADRRYTLTALISGPQDIPQPGTLQVIDNDGYRLRGVFAVGYGPTSVAVGTNTVAVVVNAHYYTGPTWVLLVPLQRVLAPAGVRLSRSHAAAGDTIEGRVNGFGPGEVLAATLQSKPIQVAQLSIGLNTTAGSFRFKVPRGITPGTHTVTVTDPLLNMTAHASFVVAAPAPSPTPTTSPRTPLANTGAHTSGLALVGLLLVVAGALVLISVHRPAARRR